MRFLATTNSQLLIFNNISLYLSLSNNFLSLSTIFIIIFVAAAAVVLLTATFGFAEYAAAGAAQFPYFQLGCLIVGGLIMVSLKRKYNKMYTAEVVGAFALYTLLMALFTNPVIDAVKNIVT